MDAGSWLHGHGYACTLPAMIAAWRALWSATPGTTDPLFPWAVAQLHDGTDLGEGFPFMLSKLRYAQTAGFGALPNKAMPNVFGISMVDQGDPWDGGETCAADACCVAPSVALGPLCVGDHRGEWTNETPDGGGSLHPRTKDAGGKRFAQAVYAAVYEPASPLLATGPVFAGCSVDAAARTLTLRFDAAQLKGERVIAAKPAGAAPMSLALENTALYLLTNASGIPVEDAEHGYNPCNYASNAGCGNNVYLGPYSNGNEYAVAPWVAVLPRAGTAANEIVVDLGPLGGATPTAVRYAAGAASGVAAPGGGADGSGFRNQRVCCGPSVDTSHEPCPPEACPLKSSNEAGGGLQLPALPFRANIVDGRCVCIAPQVCDA